MSIDRLRVGGHYYIRSVDAELARRSTLGGLIPELMRYLIRNELVDAVVAVKSGPSPLSGEPVFITKESEVLKVAGSITFAPINMAKILRDYVGRDERVAVTVKPCEELAVKYLVNAGRLRRDNLFLIGLNCGGLFHPLILNEALIKESIASSEVKDIRFERNYLEVILSSGRTVRIRYLREAVSKGLRPACMRCLNHVPTYSDVACGYWGILPGYEGHTYTIPLTVKGAEVLTRMASEGVIKVSEVPPEGRELRREAVSFITMISEISREAQFQELDSSSIESILSKCMMCLECWHACPIRSEKEVLVWRENVSPVIWQLSTITYMYDKCVECGSCEDVCPVKIPFSLIVQRVRALRERLGV